MYPLFKQILNTHLRHDYWETFFNILAYSVVIWLLQLTIGSETLYRPG